MAASKTAPFLIINIRSLVSILLLFDPPGILLVAYTAHDWCTAKSGSNISIYSQDQSGRKERKKWGKIKEDELFPDSWNRSTIGCKERDERETVVAFPRYFKGREPCENRLIVEKKNKTGAEKESKPTQIDGQHKTFPFHFHARSITTLKIYVRGCLPQSSRIERFIREGLSFLSTESLIPLLRNAWSRLHLADHPANGLVTDDPLNEY